jgi:membrane-bound ClpP family serine protease
MNDILFVTFLFAAGVLMLISELFLPAGGLLGVAGVGVLVYGLVILFGISETAGLIGIVVLAVALPAGFIVAIRNWHRTPIGKRMSPDNPKITDQDRLPIERLESLVGKVGEALTTLRPVGTCEFDGERIECKAEYGMIERGSKVEALRRIDRTISVRMIEDSEEIGS